MKMILFVVFLLVACIQPAHAQTAEEAVASVRMIIGRKGQCSAVVIAPGVLLTAKHCLANSALYVLPEETRIVRAQPSAVDAAVLYAPGVACPCARPANWFLVGPVVAVGFPNGELSGETGKVLGYGMVGPIDARERAIIHDAATRPGSSGGALFQSDVKGFVLVGIIMGYNDGASFAAFIGDVEGLPQ